MRKFFMMAAAGTLAVSVMTTGMEAVAAKKLVWAGCGISKKAFMTEMAAAYKKKTGVEIELKGGGATKGIRQVASHKVDIGGTCRHVLDDPETLNTVREERRVTLTPVGWDALVVVVHKSNPVDNITMDQVRLLYQGHITNWKQLGGKDAPVELLVRKGKISGVGRTVRELVFANYDQVFLGGKEFPSSGPLEKEVQKNPNAIAISGVSSARRMKGAKILMLNGKEANYENIKKGDYLLYRPLYMVMSMESTDPEVRREVKKFIDFVLSPEGRTIMRRVGTVPYEDAIPLWLKYLDQQNKALARMQTKQNLMANKPRPGAARR